MEEIRLKVVDAALKAVLGVKPSQFGAFRGKLQNLRRLGLPRENPGYGQKINYTRRQALELLIALQLMALGQKPSLAVIQAVSIVHQAPWGRYEGHDFYAAIRPGEKLFTGAMTKQAFLEMMITRRDPAVALLNVTSSIEKLDAALDKAVAAAD